MSKLIEKLIDEVFEMILGSFDIDLRDLKYEDLFTGGGRLGEAVG